MQNKNGLKICGIILQRIALLKVYKNPGQHRSGISDLKFRGPKKGPKTAKIWGVKKIKNGSALYTNQYTK